MHLLLKPNHMLEPQHRLLKPNHMLEPQHRLLQSWSWRLSRIPKLLQWKPVHSRTKSCSEA